MVDIGTDAASLLNSWHRIFFFDVGAAQLTLTVRAFQFQPETQVKILLLSNVCTNDESSALLMMSYLRYSD